MRDALRRLLVPLCAAAAAAAAVRAGPVFADGTDTWSYLVAIRAASRGEWNRDPYMDVAAPDLRYPYSPYFAALGALRRATGASPFRVYAAAHPVAAGGAVLAPVALARALAGPAAAAAAAPVALLIALDANDFDRLVYPSRLALLVLLPLALAAAAAYIGRGGGAFLAGAAFLAGLLPAVHTVYAVHLALGLVALALGPGREVPGRRARLLGACAAAAAPYLVVRLALSLRHPVLNPHYGTWREGLPLGAGLGVAAPVMLLQPGVLFALLAAAGLVLLGRRPAGPPRPLVRAVLLGASLPIGLAFFPPIAAAVTALSSANFLNRIPAAAAPWGIAGVAALLASAAAPRVRAATLVLLSIVALGLAGRRAAVPAKGTAAAIVARLDRVEAEGDARLPVLAFARAAAEERPDAVIACRPEIAAFLPAFVDVRVAILPEGWANPAVDVAGRLALLDRALAGDSKAARALGATHVYPGER